VSKQGKHAEWKASEASCRKPFGVVFSDRVFSPRAYITIYNLTAFFERPSQWVEVPPNRVLKSLPPRTVGELFAIAKTVFRDAENIRIGDGYRFSANRVIRRCALNSVATR
jgi:hypothetical protein